MRGAKLAMVGETVLGFINSEILQIVISSSSVEQQCLYTILYTLGKWKKPQEAKG